MAAYGPEEHQTRTGCLLILRNLEKEDGPAFIEFHRKVASETTHTLQTSLVPPDAEKAGLAYDKDVTDPLCLRVGAFEGRRMVGQLGFRPLNPTHPWVRHVGAFGMMVLEEFWGQGIGRRLIEIMHEHADRNGFVRIEALVRTQNDRGLKLYTGIGYQVEGLRRAAALIDGGFQDEHYIARVIPRAPL